MSLSHDGRGNISGIGGTGHTYSQQNLLYSIPGGNLYYDPLMRLDYISASSINANAALLDYDGADLVAERLSGGSIARRYVPGPGTDEPLVWYEGSGMSDRRWLHADERGSVVAVTDGSGSVLGVNSYDAYGKPASGNLGRFGYTGQAWLPELGMWYYKATPNAPFSPASLTNRPFAPKRSRIRDGRMPRVISRTQNPYELCRSRPFRSIAARRDGGGL